MAFYSVVAAFFYNFQHRECNFWLVLNRPIWIQRILFCIRDWLIHVKHWSDSKILALLQHLYFIFGHVLFFMILLFENLPEHIFFKCLYYFLSWPIQFWIYLILFYFFQICQEEYILIFGEFYFKISILLFVRTSSIQFWKNLAGGEERKKNMTSSERSVRCQVGIWILVPTLVWLSKDRLFKWVFLSIIHLTLKPSSF